MKVTKFQRVIYMKLIDEISSHRGKNGVLSKLEPQAGELS